MASAQTGFADDEQLAAIAGGTNKNINAVNQNAAALRFGAAIGEFGYSGLRPREVSSWNDFVLQYQNALEGETVMLTKDITAISGVDDIPFHAPLNTNITLLGVADDLLAPQMRTIDSNGLLDKGMFFTESAVNISHLIFKNFNYTTVPQKYSAPGRAWIMKKTNGRYTGTSKRNL